MLIGLLLKGTSFLDFLCSNLTALYIYKYYCRRCFRGASALRDSTTIVAITPELVETNQCEWGALYPIVVADYSRRSHRSYQPYYRFYPIRSSQLIR